MSFNSDTTGVTRRAGTANPSRGHEFTPDFSGVRVAWSFVFCVLFCRSLLVLSLLVIVLSVLPSIYSTWVPFGIFKHFLDHYSRNLHEHFCEFYFYFCLFVRFNFFLNLYMYLSYYNGHYFQVKTSFKCVGFFVLFNFAFCFELLFWIGKYNIYNLSCMNEMGNQKS